MRFLPQGWKHLYFRLPWKAVRGLSIGWGIPCRRYSPPFYPNVVFVIPAPSRRRCFALVVSDCHRKVISHSDGHSIVKVHRGITHSASKPFWSWIKSPLTIQLGNFQVIIKNFFVSNPFTSSELGRSFWQVLFEKIFCSKHKNRRKAWYTGRFQR